MSTQTTEPCYFLTPLTLSERLRRGAEGTDPNTRRFMLSRAAAEECAELARRGGTWLTVSSTARTQQPEVQHKATESPAAPTTTARAADLRPGDVVTIPAKMIGAGERRIVTSDPKVWPVSTGRVVEVDTRSEDWARSGSLALPADTILTVSRGERREEVETHNAAAAAVAASDRVAVTRQVARAEHASGGTVVTCGEHGAYIRSFGGAIGCTNTGESCDLSWGDLAGHADGRTLAWHHDFLTASA